MDSTSPQDEVDRAAGQRRRKRRQGAAPQPHGVGSDAARHRRDHRHRHLRADRHRGGQPGRARPSCSPTWRPGLACAFAALCYAEFASMVPIAGSAYTYAYASLGELVAWLIGWDLILEYAVGSMTVAIGWSGYMQRLLAGAGMSLPVWMSAAPSATTPGAIINLPAVFIVLLIMRPARHRRPRERAVQRRDGGGEDARRPVLHRRRRAVGEAGELDAVRAVRDVGGHGGRGGRLLRLHRLRRRVDDRRGGQEPAARSADRHHRLAGRLHPALSGGRRDPLGHRAGDAVPVERRRAAGHADRRPGAGDAVPERTGGIRADRHRPGLGGLSGVGRRRRRHHQRAAGDADEPAAHLLRDEPRRPAAARASARSIRASARPTSPRSSPAWSSPSSPA